MRLVGTSPVLAMHTRWAERGLQERSNLLSRLFCDGCHIKHLTRVGVPAKKCYYPEIWTKMKEHNEGPPKSAKRYDMMVAISTNIWFLCFGSTNIWFYVWDGRTDKGAAVCLHSAQVTRRDGTLVTVLCWVRNVWACGTKMNRKTSPCTFGTRKCVSSGYMRDKLEYARPQRSRCWFGQHLVTFFVLYGLATKEGSIGHSSSLRSVCSFKPGYRQYCVGFEHLPC